MLNLQHPALRILQRLPTQLEHRDKLFLVSVEVAEARSPMAFTMMVGSLEKKPRKTSRRVVVVQAAQRKLLGGIQSRV